MSRENKLYSARNGVSRQDFFKELSGVELNNRKIHHDLYKLNLYGAKQEIHDPIKQQMFLKFPSGYNDYPKKKMFDTPNQSSSISRVFNGYDSGNQSKAISKENSRLNPVSASCNFDL